MNMKTAASRSGLSARAIRFYIDSGLLSPEEFISRGRRDYEFTEEDVERLRLVSRLRGSSIPVESIKTILEEPDRTPEVFERFRDNIVPDSVRYAAFIRRLKNTDASTIGSAEELADKLEEIGTAEIANREALFNYGRLAYCDDGVSPDERLAAYRRWCERQEKRDRISNLTDWIYDVNIKWWVVVIIIAAPFVLFLLWNILSGMHYTEEVSFASSGYEVIPGDERYSEPMTIRIDGKICHMIFGEDYFVGTIRVDGYYQAVQRYKQEARLDEEVSVKLMLESDPSDNLVIADTGKKGLVYVSESDTLHMISGFTIGADRCSASAVGYDILPESVRRDKAKKRYVTAVPASGRDEALMRAAIVYEYVGWTDEFNELCRTNVSYTRK